MIGIGVGLDGELPTTTYSPGGARFSIVFPSSLHRQPMAVGGVRVPCVVVDAATADEGRLFLTIWVLEQAGPCAANPPHGMVRPVLSIPSIWSETTTSSATTSSGYVTFMSGVQLCPPQALGGSSTGGRVSQRSSCWAIVGVQRADYYIAVTVESREGPAAAESVGNSFEILGP